MPPAPKQLPAAFRRRPFTVERALTKVTYRRLRAADLRTPFRGVRVSRELEWTVALRGECALLAAPAGAVLVGVDALVVSGLPLPFGAGDPLVGAPVVAVPVGVQPPRCAGLGVRPARLHPETPLFTVGRVLVPAPEDLWAERCAVLDDESAIALGDAALRRAKGNRSRMRGAIERLPMEQRTRARGVLRLVRYEVCSPVETRLRMLLMVAGVPEASHYSKQIPREGVGRIWPDLQWESVKVAVEIDGPHHREAEQWEHDQDRNSATRQHGWSQLVFSSTKVMKRPDAVVAEISAALREAGLHW